MSFWACVFIKLIVLNDLLRHPILTITLICSLILLFLDFLSFIYRLECLFTVVIKVLLNFLSDSFNFLWRWSGNLSRRACDALFYLGRSRLLEVWCLWYNIVFRFNDILWDILFNNWALNCWFLRNRFRNFNARLFHFSRLDNYWFPDWLRLLRSLEWGDTLSNMVITCKVFRILFLSFAWLGDIFGNIIVPGFSWLLFAWFWSFMKNWFFWLLFDHCGSRFSSLLWLLSFWDQLIWSSSDCVTLGIEWD